MIPAKLRPIRPEAAPGERPAALPSLTGLRFLAALMVFAVHASLEMPFQNRMIQGIFSIVTQNAGSTGVSFFFILSGFVLTWSARPNDTSPGFWRRRALKIVPNYLVMYVVALIALLVAARPLGLAQGLADLFLVQAWVPDISFYEMAVDPVTWSLSVEIFFYASFPLLLFVVARIRPARLWYWACGTGAAIVLMPLVSQTLLPDHPAMQFGPESFVQVWFVYTFPPVRALECVLGMLLARLVMSGRWINIGLIPAVCLFLVSYGASLFVPALYTFAAVTAIPSAILIANAASADARGRPTLLMKRPLVWLGEISYAFFLVHICVLSYGHLLFGQIKHPIYGFYVGPPMGVAPALLFLAGAMGVSVLASWGLYSLVERPIIRRWSRGARGRTRAKSAT